MAYADPVKIERVLRHQVWAVVGLTANPARPAYGVARFLQARGKTIGIISHVAALQERIPTQIVVKKESAGCSRITILN